MEEAEACLMRLEGTAEAQRAALQHGLQLTSTVRGPAGQPPADAPPGEHGSAQPSAGGDAAAAVRRQRLRLLQHLERLDTAIMLMNGAWRPPAFAALRDCTAAEAAGALAAAGRLPAVLVLLARHPRALLPSILDVLSAVPETVDAKQLAPLLRQVASLRKPSPLPREPDWVESAATAAELREAGQYALLLATEPMCAASGAGRGSSSGGSSGGTSGGAAGWHPPTERQLAAWVCERAQQLDATTGQLPNALALLEAGGATLHYGQPSISALLVLGQELLSLIKLVTSRGDGSSTWHMDLRQYAALSPAQRLSLLLGLLGGDSLADDLALHVAPFLARLGSGGSRSGQDGETADPQVVLRQALEAESVTRLGWVVRLIQSEARQPAVFSDAAQLAKTVGACCYACQATDAWELLNSMLSAARDALRADHSLGRDEQEAAAEGLAAVRGHVTAARLLTKHGLTTPVSTVRDADRAAALRLLRTLLARVSRTKNTESRWVEVWMDARSIQEHGFGQLSEEEVRTEFCRALLRAGQYRLCSSYLKPLRPEAAEQLVLAAGREVYLSASSMTDRAVKQAKECFSLLPASAAAREQLAGIAAAEQLQKLGLDLPPLQLQQLHAQAAAGDTQALEQLLAEHPKLLAADSGTLGQLAAALGLEQQQQPLLLRAAAAAHAAGELRRAESLLRVLVEHRYRPAWQLAATVSQDARCRRGELLAFALASAPADQLLALLLQWQAADSGQGSDCWGLFSAADAAADSPDGWAEQQRWLARQLRLHLIALGRSSACGGTGGGSGDARGSEACSSRDAADAVQLCQECLGHMSPMHAAAAAAFAAAKGPCPLVLPPGGPQLAARTLPEEQQLAILGSALDIVASAEASADAVAALEADAAPGELLTQLRQRHALLSALASLAACCPAPAQQRAARAAAAALQQAAQDGDSSSAASSPLLAHCLQQLLTAGCPAPGVLQATAMLQALQQQPEQAPPDVHAALAAPAAAAAAQQAVGSAAEAAVAPALHAMSGSAEQNAAGQSATDGQPLSAGDAVQNLFALLRSLHHLPETSSSPALDKPSAVAEAAAADAAAEAVGTLRVRVWQQLQQHAAQYDGSGGAAATEAHLQVLELLGSIGTTMWPGWSPPAAALLPSGGSDSNPSEPAQPGMLSSHQRALLFTRTAAVLAQEWPTALQQCRLSAADFGSAEAAEAALLQLAAAAEGPQHLRLLLHLLQEGLADAFPPAAAEPEPTGALAATDVALQPPAAAENKAAAGQVLPEAAASRQQPVAPLHRVWASSLRMLLPFGDLDGALAALEQHSAPQEQQQQQAQQPAPAAAPLTEEEAAALLEAADATQGAAAAAALALLLPNRRLCRARWQQLLQACSSGATGAADLAAALPGLSSLLLLLVQQQQAPLAELAADQHAQQQLLKVLLAAALQQQAAAQAYCTPLGSSALTLRMAVAAAAAAQLVEARQYTAAAWVAMQVSGTPRLLRVLDNATRVLQQLLRSCAAGSPAAAAAAAAVRKLDSGAAPPGLALPHTAAALLRGLPERCAAALARMNADLQL
ncbi:hypothetical protein ABPG75_012472 [Micractinium tetrahymenae]